MAIVVQKIKTKEFKYIPVDERESENPVVFKLRLVPKTERAKLEDGLLKISQDGTFNFANATYILEMFKRGVVDIEGLVDEEGNLIKVKKEHGVIADSFIEMLPDELIQEVGNVIIAISKDPKNYKIYLGETEEEQKEE